MYTLALREHPGDDETRCYRGWTYLLTDAPRLAQEDFEICLRKKPTHADALAGRATARIHLNEVESALEDARAAEKHGPATPRLLYNLACVYARAADLFRPDARAGSPRLDGLVGKRLALYEQKALDYLRRTMEDTPAKSRAAFWRAQVEGDPDLNCLRQGKKLIPLAEKYGKGRVTP
jgi:hypothetical protein